MISEAKSNMSLRPLFNFQICVACAKFTDKIVYMFTLLTMLHLYRLVFELSLPQGNTVEEKQMRL